jgi:hypothetical protein
MATWTWYGTEQVVPEMNAQDGKGTLILRPGQEYGFEGDPPGDPAYWAEAVPPKTPPALPPPPPQTETAGG